MSRRDFLRLVGVVAGLLGVDAARAARALRGFVPVVWFLGQGCAGCTSALLESSIGGELVSRGVGVVGGVVRVVLNPLLSVASGGEFLGLLEAAVDGAAVRVPGVGVVDFSDGFIVVLEGALPLCRRGGSYMHCSGAEALVCYMGLEGGEPVPCSVWFGRLLGRARGVLAVGNCACYGGVRADGVWGDVVPMGFFPDRVRGLPGLINVLGEAGGFRRPAAPMCVGSPGLAVAVPGCPANGEAIARTIIAAELVVAGAAECIPVDEYWRPRIIYGDTTHSQCPRLDAYRAGVFREEPGEPSGGCLYMVGCKGRWSHCPWNMVGWVDGVGGPTRTGGVCIGCTMPGFPDSFEPFYERRGRRRGRRRV